MRIWDIPTTLLCRKHLFGEHLELHAIWSIIVNGKIGYAHHPETERWRGKLKALYNRHEEQVKEIVARGYNHGSGLLRSKAIGSSIQDTYIHTSTEQREILRNKKCDCKVN